MCAQKGILKSGTSWTTSWGNVLNVGWANWKFVLMKVLHICLGQWLWICFEQKTIGVIDEGRPKKMIKEAFKETIVSTFLEYL